jgi:hypothetical protein
MLTLVWVMSPEVTLSMSSWVSELHGHWLHSIMVTMVNNSLFQLESELMLNADIVLKFTEIFVVSFLLLLVLHSP